MSIGIDITGAGGRENMLVAMSSKANRKRLSVTKTVTGNVHFSSKTVEWATPRDFFDKLDLEFHFTVD